MDLRPVVWDISSSDEDDIFRSGGSDSCTDLDYDWISELFHDGDDDDDDEVVLLSEVVVSKKKRRKVAASPEKKKAVASEAESDDDCVVLEGDPDKAAVEVERNGGGEVDADELMIVGEKGQIACRDYPHARHLCAKFLFDSTPHEQHCPQCHCYVCDSLAPCLYWGNGGANTDHCHSTDQDPFWRAQRQTLKQGDKAQLQFPQIPTSSVLLPPPPLPPPPPPPPPPAQASQDLPFALAISRMTAMRACATSTNSGIPNSTFQRRSQPLNTSSRNKFNSHLVSQQLHTSPNNSGQNVGRLNTGNLAPQYMNRPAILKRHRSAEVVTKTSRPGYVSSNGYQASRNTIDSPPLVGLSNKNSTYQQHSVSGTGSVSSALGNHLQKSAPFLMSSMRSSQVRVCPYLNRGTSSIVSMPSQPRALTNPNTVNSFANTAPLQQSRLQTNTGNTFVTSLPFSQAISQPNTVCLQNSVISQTQVLSQPNMASSYFLPPLEVSSQPNVGISNSENSVPCQPQEFPSQANVGNSSINTHYSQSQAYNQPNDLQEGNQTQSPIDLGFSDLSPTWLGPTTHLNQTDNSAAQDPGLAYSSLLSELDSESTIENTNQNSCFYENDNWMDFVSIDGFGVHPPEATTVDTGFLFD